MTGDQIDEVVERSTVDRMHCDVLSYDLGVDIEWCSVCGAIRVNADRWIEPQRLTGR